MKYQNKSFSVYMGNKQYSDNYDKIFKRWLNKCEKCQEQYTKTEAGNLKCSCGIKYLDPKDDNKHE